MSVSERRRTRVKDPLDAEPALHRGVARVLRTCSSVALHWRPDSMELNFVQIFINVAVCISLLFCIVMFILRAAQLVQVVRRARAVCASKRRLGVER